MEGVPSPAPRTKEEVYEAIARRARARLSLDHPGSPHVTVFLGSSPTVSDAVSPSDHQRRALQLSDRVVELEAALTSQSVELEAAELSARNAEAAAAEAAGRASAAELEANRLSERSDALVLCLREAEVSRAHATHEAANATNELAEAVDAIVAMEAAAEVKHAELAEARAKIRTLEQLFRTLRAESIRKEGGAAARVAKTAAAESPVPAESAATGAAQSPVPVESAAAGAAESPVPVESAAAGAAQSPVLVENAAAESAAEARRSPMNSQADAVEALFNRCDKNKDGKVTIRELKTALKAHEHLLPLLGMHRLKDAHTFMATADTDGDQAVDLGEFRALMQRLQPPPAEPAAADPPPPVRVVSLEGATEPASSTLFTAGAASAVLPYTDERRDAVTEAPAEEHTAQDGAAPARPADEAAQLAQMAYESVQDLKEKLTPEDEASRNIEERREKKKKKKRPP